MEKSQLAGYPALQRLGLDAEDLQHLASQGFVSTERRGACVFAKLRFRKNGRQEARYIGNSERAAEVSRELQLLQSARLALRELDKLNGLCQQMLRESNAHLRPLVEQHGWAFHGRAIRRPRRVAG
ncbi:MAG: hypothetical protein ABIU95_04980 [Burkholderiales bacterium]